MFDPAELEGVQLTPEARRHGELFAKYLHEKGLIPHRPSTALAAVGGPDDKLAKLQAKLTPKDRGELARDWVLRADGDKRSLASVYEVSIDELELLLEKDPVILATVAHLQQELQNDPIAVMRINARDLVTMSMTKMATIISSASSDDKDKIQAFKQLVDLADVESQTGKHAKAGTTVMVNFGSLTPTGFGVAPAVKVS